MKAALKILSCIFVLLLFFCCLPQRPEPGEYADLARKFLTLLVQKNYADAVSMYNSIMKNTLPSDKLENIWEDILNEVGGYEDEITCNEKQEGQFTNIVLTCRFTNIPLDIKIVFNPGKEIVGLWFLPAFSAYDPYIPPEYVDQELFTETEVMFGDPEWKLPGILSIPNSDKSCPVVILVHGSGPQDRDETIGPNKPFKDIAWGLASKGIAVFRYVKRTMRYPAKSREHKKDMTVKEETIDDTLSAVAFLKTQRNLNPDRIFILGHSLGGMLIPRIALHSPETAGYIILAGPTRPLEVLLLEQTEYIINLDKKVTKDEKKKFDELKNKVAKLKQGELSYHTREDELPMGISASYWIDLKGYMPQILASEISKPFLVLQGGRDYQVTEVDFNGWKNAFKERTDTTLIMYKNLNHFFITGQGKSIPSEYYEQGHVEEKVIEDIALWIKSICR